MPIPHSVRVSIDIHIYRVYIGRLANWDQAHRVVQTLRGKPPYSYSLSFYLASGGSGLNRGGRELIEK